MKNIFRISPLAIASALAVLSISISRYSTSSYLISLARILAFGGIALFLYATVRGFIRMTRAEKKGEENWLIDLFNRLTGDSLTIFLFFIVGGGTALVQLTSYLWSHSQPGLGFILSEDLRVLILFWAGFLGWVVIWAYRVLKSLGLKIDHKGYFFDSRKWPKPIRDFLFFLIVAIAATGAIGSVFFGFLAAGYYLTQIYLLIISPSALWVW